MDGGAKGSMKGTMKGISVWIWVIGGIIVGFILLTVFLQLVSYITRTREVEIAKGSFGELATNARTICQTIAGSGASRLDRKFTFPQSVSDIFSVNTTATTEIPTGEKSYGRMICMKVYEEFVCEDVACNVELNNIKNRETLTTTINRILGRIGTNEYELKIIKTPCGVAILKPEMGSSCHE